MENEAELRATQDELRVLKQDLTAATLREEHLKGDFAATEEGIKVIKSELAESEALVEETKKELELRGEKYALKSVKPFLFRT